MPRATAQIVIILDPETGEYRAEVPQGALRRKITLPPDPLFWGEIIQEALQGQEPWLEQKFLDEKRAKQQLKIAEPQFQFTLAQHKRIWDQSAQNHGPKFTTDKFGLRASPNVRPKSVAQILDWASKRGKK